MYRHNIVSQIKRRSARHMVRVTCEWRLPSPTDPRRCFADVFADIRSTAGMPIARLVPLSTRAEASQVGISGATYRQEFIAVQFCHATSQNVTHEKSRICASGLSVDACVACDRFPLPIRLHPPIRGRDFPVYADLKRRQYSYILHFILHLCYRASNIF